MSHPSLASRLQVGRLLQLSGPHRSSADPRSSRHLPCRWGQVLQSGRRQCLRTGRTGGSPMAGTLPPAAAVKTCAHHLICPAGEACSSATRPPWIGPPYQRLPHPGRRVVLPGSSACRSLQLLTLACAGGHPVPHHQPGERGSDSHHSAWRAHPGQPAVCHQSRCTGWAAPDALLARRRGTW